MAEYRRTTGLVVAGHGLDSAKSGGTAFCYGDVPTGSTSYDWNTCLTNSPRTVGITVSPTTGGFEGSSFTFSLAANDDVAELLQWQQKTTPYTLAVGRGSTATQVIILDEDGNEVSTLGGQVIWLGDEAILLGEYNSGITIGSYTGGYGVTRGYYSTTATDHVVGAHVYAEAPHFLQYRECFLVLYDWKTETESILWRGLINDLETRNDGTTIDISTTDIYSFLQDAEINRGAISHGEKYYRSRDTYNSVYGALGKSTPPTVFKGGEADPNFAIQLGDDVFGYQTYDLSTGASNNLSFPTYWGIGTDWFGDSANLPEAYEIFAVDYSRDAVHVNSDGTAKGAMATNGYSATRELEYPFHPLSIFLGFLLSTTSDTASQSDYDVYGPEWSLQLPSSMVDIAAFEALIAEYPTFRVERLLLGWDGEPVNVWDMAWNNLLKPFGFYLGTNTNGKLNVGHLTTNLGVGAFYNSPEVEPIPNQARWQASKNEAVDEVIGIFSQTPWADGNTTTIRGPANNNRNSIRSRLVADDTTLEYQMPYGQAVASSDDRTTVVGAGRAYAYLQSRAQSGAYAIPRVIFRFRDTAIEGASYNIGDYISPAPLDLENAWVVDSTGTRIQIGNTKDLSLSGPIIGRELDLETLTYTLTILLQGQTGRLVLWRATSAVVDSGSTTTVIQVEQNAFHSGTDDTSYFTVGDEIQVSEDDGTQLVFGATITALTSTSITVDSALGVTPSAGNIVRLTPYTGYANSAVITGGPDNVYVFLSNDGTKLGSSDDIHRYG